MSKIESFFLAENPLRSAYLSTLKRFGLKDYSFFLENNYVDKPAYAHIISQGAQLAKRLGIDRVSVIEFGVAGGNGLLHMERHAEQVEQMLGVKIEIYGFDTGEGLPAPEDYRDLPYHWEQGFYKMDQQALRDRLKRSQLVIGDVRETINTFCQKYNPAPIAAISNDFDYYSSTIAANKLFDSDSKYMLPRIFCYFDDTIGTEVELYSDYTGQRAAIADFNASNTHRKIARPYYFEAKRSRAKWFSQIFIYHDFNHPLYNKFVSSKAQENPLNLKDNETAQKV